MKFRFAFNAVVLALTLFLSACADSEMSEAELLRESETAAIQAFAANWCKQRNLISYDAWLSLRSMEEALAFENLVLGQEYAKDNELNRADEEYCLELATRLVELKEVNIKLHAENIDLRPLLILRKIKTLTLWGQENRLGASVLGALKELPALTRLRLNRFRIETLSMSSLPPRLEELEVRYSSLESVDPEPPPGLKRLILSNNKLKDIPILAIPFKSDVELLNISGNPLDLDTSTTGTSLGSTIFAGIQFPRVKTLKITLPHLESERDAALDSLKRVFPNASIISQFESTGR